MPLSEQECRDILFEIAPSVRDTGLDGLIWTFERVNRSAAPARQRLAAFVQIFRHNLELSSPTFLESTLRRINAVDHTGSDFTDAGIDLSDDRFESIGVLAHIDAAVTPGLREELKELLEAIDAIDAPSLDVDDFDNPPFRGPRL